MDEQNKKSVNPKMDVITILVVDDIQENLDLLSEVLHEKGYQVLTARSGFDALQIVAREEVHVIVADAMMPRMDGLELCKQIRSLQINSLVPFIIYTGNYIDKEDEELARSVGVDRYVMKHSGVEPLVGCVAELTLHRYGYDPKERKERPNPIDDQSFIVRHHDIVTKKLEEKMHELQLYAETLARKNRELLASQSRYRGLFENASIAIFVLDTAARKIVDVNKQGVTLLGYTKEEICQTSMLPMVSGQSESPDIYDFTRVNAREYSLRTKRGDLIQVDVSAGPVMQPDEKMQTLIFVRDITEQKRMRDQLLQSEKMSTMGHLAAGIAHEIRNPLAGISLNLQFLDRRDTLDQLDHESVASALEGTVRIQQIIEDILGLARITPPNLSEGSINPIIEKALLYLKFSLRQKALKIRTELEQHLPKIQIDGNQIQQVLLNLLNNAVDASPHEGTIQISTAMVHGDPLGVSGSRRSIALTVRDSGPGLSDDALAHLFEPFRTSKSEGTGLGLVLSKYIIDRHQGSISLTNAPEGGAVVQILLPIPTRTIEEIHD